MHELTGRTHWHEPSGNSRAGFGEFGRPKTPYDLFMESEGIPIFRDIGVSKVQNLPLAHWKRLGGKGSYIQLHGTEGKWGCYLVEVPGAGALNAEKHLYEEVYYVVEGRGTTEVWLDNDSKRHVFEWQQGSLFSIPVNAWHRIVNASSAPALLLAGTTAPNLLNLVNNVDVMFNCPYEFRDRFSGADDFYKYKDDIEPDPVRGLAMRRTNFVPDIVNCDLPLDNRRSPGWRRVEPFMTGNTFYLWIGQHENGRYSKAHAHTSAAVLICLKGKGYTYTWPERYGVTPWKDGHADQIKRVDYEPVGMVSAAPGGARWFLGVTPWKDGHAEEIKRVDLRAGRHGLGRARRGALVSPALRRLEGPAAAHRLVRAAQSGTRARAARREAHRLHRDGHPRGRHRHPVLDGRPLHQRRVRGQAQGRGRAEPDGARLLQEGRRGAEIRRRVRPAVIPGPTVEVGLGRLQRSEPGIHNHRTCSHGEDRGYGFRARATGRR